MEIVWRGTKEELLNRLRSLPKVLTGQVSDPYGVSEALRVRLANAFLKKAHDAAVVKGQHERGDDDIEWTELQPATKKWRKRPANKWADPFGPILENQGKLLRALVPGKDDQPGSQKLVHTPQSVTVTIDDPRAGWHHHGTENMVARRLWPEEGHMTAPWQEALVEAAVQGITAALRRMVV